SDLVNLVLHQDGATPFAINGASDDNAVSATSHNGVLAGNPDQFVFKAESLISSYIGNALHEGHIDLPAFLQHVDADGIAAWLTSADSFIAHGGDTVTPTNAEMAD